MNTTVKKVLSIIFVALMCFGIYASAFGVGPVKNLKESLKYGLDINGGVYVVMEADTDLTGTELKTTMEQTRNVLERRVDAMGVANATVTVEGDKRLRVEMPGVDDAKTAINRIGETAKLRFTTSDNTEYLDGEDIKDATADTDTENGGYKIVLTFTKEGQKKFAQATEKASSGNVTATVQDEEGNKAFWSSTERNSSDAYYASMIHDYGGASSAPSHAKSTDYYYAACYKATE